MSVRAEVEPPWLSNTSPSEMRRIVDALYRVHGLLAAITEPDSLLERIMEESKRVADAEACSLLLYDKTSEELYFHVALGEQGDQSALKTQIRLKLGQGIAGTAASTRKSINVEEASNDPRFFRDADAASQFHTRSLLAVPLVEHDELIGVVEVLNKRGGGSFSETDLHVLEMFSALAASAFANARLIENLLRSERLAALGQAVASLSHHTKNIIAGMSGSVDLIDEGIERGNMTFLRTGWPILRRSVGRISNFVEDMLAYSKPRKPQCELVEAQQLVDDVTISISSTLMNRGIVLETDLTGVQARVNCDAPAMYRALLNLLTNAAEAVPNKGGRIRISCRTDREGRCVIEVSDNGPGIPFDERVRIFEPFFSTKGSKGTGLGLAVTKKIIDEHNGEISVEDGPERGALFRIILPSGPGLS
jgi:signal transduction histidine kinase